MAIPRAWDSVNNVPRMLRCDADGRLLVKSTGQLGRALKVDVSNSVDGNGDTVDWIHVTNGFVDLWLNAGVLNSTYGMDSQAGVNGYAAHCLNWEPYLGGYQYGSSASYPDPYGSALNWGQNAGGTANTELQKHLQHNFASLTRRIRFYKTEADALADCAGTPFNGTSSLKYYRNPANISPSVEEITVMRQRILQPFDAYGNAYPAIRIKRGGKVIAGYGCDGVAANYGAEATTGAISTATLGAAGTGYTVGDILTLADGTGGQARVLTITGGGGTGPVGTFKIVAAGSGYTVATHATTGGTGNSDCTIAVATIHTAPPDSINFGRYSPTNWGSDAIGGDRMVGAVIDWPYDPLETDEPVTIEVYIKKIVGTGFHLGGFIFPAHGIEPIESSYDIYMADTAVTVGWNVCKNQAGDTIPGHILKKGTNFIAFMTSDWEVNANGSQYLVMGGDTSTPIVTSNQLKNYICLNHGTQIIRYSARTQNEYWTLYRDQDKIKTWTMAQVGASQKFDFLAAWLGSGKVATPGRWQSANGGGNMMAIQGSDMPFDRSIKRDGVPNKLVSENMDWDVSNHRPLLKYGGGSVINLAVIEDVVFSHDGDYPIGYHFEDDAAGVIGITPRISSLVDEYCLPARSDDQNGLTGSGCTLNTTLTGDALATVVKNAAGDGYYVGQILCVANGATPSTMWQTGLVRVTAITGGESLGPVDTVEIVQAGSGYDSSGGHNTARAVIDAPYYWMWSDTPCGLTSDTVAEGQRTIAVTVDYTNFMG